MSWWKCEVWRWVVCHGRGLSSGLDPAVAFIFYKQNIVFHSTITMVLDLLQLDHCMDEDNTQEHTYLCDSCQPSSLLLAFLATATLLPAILFPHWPMSLSQTSLPQWILCLTWTLDTTIHLVTHLLQAINQILTAALTMIYAHIFALPITANDLLATDKTSQHHFHLIFTHCHQPCPSFAKPTPIFLKSIALFVNHANTLHHNDIVTNHHLAHNYCPLESTKQTEHTTAMVSNIILKPLDTNECGSSIWLWPCSDNMLSPCFLVILVSANGQKLKVVVANTFLAIFISAAFLSLILWLLAASPAYTPTGYSIQFFVSVK